MKSLESLLIATFTPSRIEITAFIAAISYVLIHLLIQPFFS